MSRRKLAALLQVERFEETGEVDRYGNPKTAYVAEDVAVYAVAPKQSVEPDENGRRAVVTGVTVYAPVDVEVGPNDRVLWRGERFEVVGEVARWDHSPHNTALPSFGIQFDLERSAG